MPRICFCEALCALPGFEAYHGNDTPFPQGAIVGQDGPRAHNFVMCLNPREQSQVLLNGQRPVHKSKPERI